MRKKAGTGPVQLTSGGPLSVNLFEDALVLLLIGLEPFTLLIPGSCFFSARGVDKDEATRSDFFELLVGCGLFKFRCFFLDF